GWRKSYILRPAIRPEAVRHVLVGVMDAQGGDLTALWHSTASPDTATAPGQANRAGRDTVGGR
ncbi:MAG: hypothetical protein ACRELX_16175, partial [Longimicrobiales bacterium]